MYSPAARFIMFYRNNEEKQQRIQLFLSYISKWEEHELVDDFPVNTKVYKDAYEVFKVFVLEGRLNR